MTARTRTVLIAVLAAAVAVAAVVVMRGGTLSGRATSTSTSSVVSTTSTTLRPTTTIPPTTTTTIPPVPASSLTLVRRNVIGGHISPKSVDASSAGLVFAQNMMYTHTVTVYGTDGTLKATIPDSVDLSSFGISGHPGISRGAPVEAAFTHNGRYAYVSNYSMYGANWGPEGSDSCNGPSGYDPSYVYRIDTQKLAIDQVIAVGTVPKYVAVTPNDKYVLVSNWCSFDLSVIDRAAAREVHRIPIGRYPRGIAVSPDSSVAYVAEMGGRDIAVIDLHTFSVSWIRNVGDAPRHLVLSHDGRTLYATLNADGVVAKIDVGTRQVVARVHTGGAPRSMVMSSDGTTLYVVNYDSSTMSALRTSDLGVIQTLPTNTHPIGITYEPTTRSVWVACYVGDIIVFGPS